MRRQCVPSLQASKAKSGRWESAQAGIVQILAILDRLATPRSFSIGFNIDVGINMTRQCHCKPWRDCNAKPGGVDKNIWHFQIEIHPRSEF